MQSQHLSNVFVFFYFPTCVDLVVATEGPLGRPVAPVFSSVPVPGGPALFGYRALHVVVVGPSFVPVAAPGPAVAQRRCRALHGTAVVDGLRWGGKRKKPPNDGRRERGQRERGMQGEMFSLTVKLMFAVNDGLRDNVCVNVCM